MFLHIYTILRYFIPFARIMVVRKYLLNTVHVFPEPCDISKSPTAAHRFSKNYRLRFIYVKTRFVLQLSSLFSFVSLYVLLTYPSFFFYCFGPFIEKTRHARPEATTNERVHRSVVQLGRVFNHDELTPVCFATRHLLHRVVTRVRAYTEKSQERTAKYNV